MDNRERLSILKDRHSRLDKQINEMTVAGSYTDEQITNKKKEKLAIKDEIRRLERVIWDDDHNTFHMDNDR